jgi:hypothetical protein
MARDHARIYVSIWSNEDFRNLPTTAQNMWFTILSQPRLSYCGVLDYLPTRLARLAKDSTVPKVQRAIGVLENAKFAITDPDTGELLLRTFVRHDGLLDQPNMAKAMAKDYETVLSPVIQAAIESELARAFHEGPDMKGWVALESRYPNLYAKATGNPSARGSAKGSANG